MKFLVTVYFLVWCALTIVGFGILWLAIAAVREAIANDPEVKAGEPEHRQQHPLTGELESALENLGYSDSDARARAQRTLAKLDQDATIERALKFALRE